MSARRMTLAAALIAGASLPAAGGACAAPGYAWLDGDPAATIADSFAVPDGFRRVAVGAGSFGDWLRHLPLKPADSGVTLHDGRPVADHGTVAAVVDIDVGRNDLQQCADAVMRLRAEYLFSRRLTGLIGFALYSGERYRFAAYAEGQTPVPAGASIAWQSGPPRDTSHASLRRWLDIVYGFASTRSLARELRPVDSLADAALGDVFIHPGTPGHAVIIADLAIDPASNRRLALLVQSSMPARDVHVLRNTLEPRLGAWFALVDAARSQRRGGCSSPMS
jgi:Domain of unknown function (4846)